MIGKKEKFPSLSIADEISSNSEYEDDSASDDQNNSIQLNIKLELKNNNNLLELIPTKNSPSKLKNQQTIVIKSVSASKSKPEKRIKEKQGKNYKTILIIILLTSILCVSYFSLRMVLDIKAQHNILSPNNHRNSVKKQNQQIYFLENNKNIKTKTDTQVEQKFLKSLESDAIESDQISNIQNPQNPKIIQEGTIVKKLQKNVEPIQQIKIESVKIIKQASQAIPTQIKKQNPPTQSLDIEQKLNKKIGYQTLQQWSQIITEKAKLKKAINPEDNLVALETKCQEQIAKMLKDYGNLYSLATPPKQLKLRSGAQNYYANPSIQISKQKFLQVIDLIDMIHRVDKNMNMIINQSPCEGTEEKRQRIFAAANQQYIRWNQQYEINRFHSKQLRFCIVVNSYNNAYNGLIYRNVDSILQQNYTNYHVIYRDDMSPDQTGQKVKAHLLKNEIGQDKFKVKINTQKVGMMENIYRAMTQNCRQGEIAVMLDGDDSFIGTNVLSLLNAVYQKQQMALIWSQFAWIYNNNKVNMGYSGQYTEAQKMQGFRTQQGFLSSHLKSFFVDLFRKLKLEDLQENSGKFYGGASDTAMMIPMLQLAGSKYKYLPEILYEYRYDTGQVGNSVNAGPQRIAIAKIYSSPPYQKLTDFSFIDNAIQNAIDINK